MISLFQYNAFNEFLKNWVADQPNNGRGLYREIAEHLRISPVLMSQFMSGSRLISEDHAFAICDFLKFTGSEKEFLILLVQKERSGTANYKKYIEQKIEDIRRQSSQPKNRIVEDASLSLEAQSIFYSHWKYSFIRLATSIEKINSVESIANFLNLPRSEVSDAIEFLKKYSLIIETKNGFAMGPQRTHLPKESPYYFSRQQQLRFLAGRGLEKNLSDDLFYSAPISISKEDALWVREALLDVVSKLSKKIDKSVATDLYCLNLDWFQFPK